MGRYGEIWGGVERYGEITHLCARPHVCIVAVEEGV